jgi:preprotein translocase subunit SecA
MLEDLLEDAILAVCDDQKKPINWDLNQLKERYKFILNKELSLPSNLELSQQAIFDFLRTQAKNDYNQLASEQSAILANLKNNFSEKGISVSISEASEQTFDFTFETFEQSTFLENIDKLWLIQLQNMDHLREGIGLRGYGQKNPKHEYQKEGFELFKNMLEQLKEATVRAVTYTDASQLEDLLKHIAEEQERRSRIEEQMKLTHPTDEEAGNAKELEVNKDPNSQKAKLEAQRRERRKLKKK